MRTLNDNSNLAICQWLEDNAYPEDVIPGVIYVGGFKGIGETGWCVNNANEFYEYLDDCFEMTLYS